MNEAEHFIEEIILEDLKTEKYNGRVHTRFPPEPNGFLHIGHAKAIHINFSLADKHQGLTNLRFDDTNPVSESEEYVQAIKEDIKWLGYDWGDRVYYTSDYFHQLYEFALQLIKQEDAYVDESSSEEIAEMRGDENTPGTNSPYRDRPVEENLKLFQEMVEGKHKEGSMVLRAKVDMSHPNLHMRDPVIYRILHKTHHRTGDNWKVYPNYDFAHGQSDAIEKITHSLCSLEFAHHRPLYNWFIDRLGIFPSKQIEFARLNLSYTVLSKRKLLQLIEEGYVSGWDDPRMPTLRGFRRRGYSPQAIRNFAERVGVTRRNNLIDFGLLEHSLRDDLNKRAERRMAVIDPIALTLTNLEEGKILKLPSENNPEDPEAGERILEFSRELWIERDDFMVDPPKKFFRLGPGRNVRLKSAFIITCTDYELDDKGNITHIYAEYHPASKSGEDTSGIKAKGTLHWVSRHDAVDAEVRSYDRLFQVENPLAEEGEFTDYINENNLIEYKNVKIEPSLRSPDEKYYQFMRKGYYIHDWESTPSKPVFNMTVGLRDSWARKNS